MRQAARVLEVYKELRVALGAKKSASEILACAASLVELFSIEEGVPVFDDSTGRTPPSMLPLDSAIADGGWRILANDWGWMDWETDYDCAGIRPSHGLQL